MAADVNRNMETIRTTIVSASNWQLKSTSAVFFSKTDTEQLPSQNLLLKPSGPDPSYFLVPSIVDPYKMNWF